MNCIVLGFLILSLAACQRYQLMKSSDEGAADLSSYSLANCQYVRNSNNRIVSWKGSVPVHFYLSQNIPEEWRSVISEAAAVWVSPEGKPLIKVQSEISSSLSSASDRKNVIYWVDSGSLFNYQQAQTVARWTQSQLQDADILVNARDFRFFNGSSVDQYRIHLKSLLVHEFGHALGLKHTTEVLSVMYPELAFMQIRADLSETDVTSRNCEYL